jgi:hypothetical protein
MPPIPKNTLMAVGVTERVSRYQPWIGFPQDSQEVKISRDPVSGHMHTIHENGGAHFI